MIKVWIPSLKVYGHVEINTNSLTWRSKTGKVITVDANALNWISEPLESEVPEWSGGK